LFLKQHHITFNEQRVNSLLGAGEDADLGKQIELVHGDALYDRNAVVYHKDPKTWGSYWKKYFRSLAAYQWYLLTYEKTPTIQIRKKIRLRSLVAQYVKKNRYSVFNKLLLFSLIYITVAISFFLILCFQFRSFQRRYVKLFQ
jgi:hypothetical protein